MFDRSEFETDGLREFFEAFEEEEFGRRGGARSRGAVSGRAVRRRPAPRRMVRTRPLAGRTSAPRRRPIGRKRPVLKRRLPLKKRPIRFPFPAVLTPGIFPGLFPQPSDQPKPTEPTSPPGSGPSGPTSAPPPTNGDQSSGGSEQVRWVQSTLNRILGLNLPINGVMSEETRNAIKQFQQQKGLPVDGLVGPPTERALVEASSSAPQAAGADAGGPPQPDAAAAPSADAGGAEPAADAGAEPPADAELYEFFEVDEFAASPRYGQRKRSGKCGCRKCNRQVRRQDQSHALLSELFEQDQFGESEVDISQVPQSVLSLLRSGLETAGVKLAATFGYRNESQLTDIIFHSRHPERLGRGISSSEPNYNSLVAEWLSIRNNIVRPALSGSSSAPSAPSPAAPTSTGGLDIIDVRGIKVARQIASQVRDLLAAADADGIRLSGGGFRSPAKQIELRRKHCGPTNFDIYEKKSSSCTPPTARPGQSNHERGLAIDFTYNGAGIKDHNNPGFKWLAANAEHFGLFNLKSEPWHWSYNGR